MSNDHVAEPFRNILDNFSPGIPRGKYIGKPVGPPIAEAEHFIKCGGCDGWIDCRDLGSVFDHEGPLPHPACDRPS